jgi:RecG-like helicase
MGIHKPKDRSEADLARRRLIFDDFFYLQVSLLLSVSVSARLLVDICARAHCIC